VTAIAERVLSCHGKVRTVTPGWWTSFTTRHPNLVLCTPATLSLARATVSDPDIIDNYFNELESTSKVNEILEKPCQIFNIDETGMPLDPKPLKIVTWKGHKNPSQVSSGVKSQITVVGCVSAGGHCLPPMVIWDRKSLPPEWRWGRFQGLYMGYPARAGLIKSYFTCGSPSTSSCMLLQLVHCCC